MAPPLSAGFIIMSLLLRMFVNAWISVGGILVGVGGGLLEFMMSLVVTLINASSAVDFPAGGVQPLDCLNGSVTVCVESLKWCLSRRRRLKSSVSLCRLSISAEAGCGQKDRPRHKTIFSSRLSL